MSLRTLHHLGLFAALGLALASVMPGSTLLLVSALVLLAVMIGALPLLVGRARPRWLPLVVHGLTVLGLITALALFRRVAFDAVVLIVMLGIFNRYTLRSGHRDDLILLGASGVLLATGTLITPGIGFFLLILLYLPAVNYALLAAQILASAEREPLDRRESTRRSLLASPAPRGKLRLAMAMILISAIGYGSMAIFPRYHFVRWLGAGSFLQLAGVASSMELHTDGVRAPVSGSIVMRVLSNDKIGEVDLGGIYARLYAMDKFDGRVFSAEEELGNRAESSVPKAKRESVAPVEILLERMDSGQGRSPIATLGRTGPSQVNLFLTQAPSGTFWGRGQGNASLMSYKVDLSLPMELPKPKEGSPRLARMLEVPSSVDPRMRALAESLTRDRDTTDAKVNAILEYFARGYKYSLDPLAGESDDPLVRFLFEAKQGHCELYAGAVTVLLRLAGVPARVATGYYGGYYNNAGGYLELGSADAHAWVELWDEARGWRWVDATPEDERVRREKSFGWFSDWVEALEMVWYEQVVDFDEARRRRIMDDLGERFASAGGDLNEWASKGQGSGGAPPLLVMGAVLSLLLAAAGGLLLRRRALSPESLGLSLRDALGAKPEDNLTLGALLGRAPAHVAGEAARAVALYEALRFGPAPEAPAPGEVRLAVRALLKKKQRR